MFISEQASGTTSELESRDVSFLENEFPSIGEVDKNFQFYNLKYPNEIITSNDGVCVSTDPLGIAILSGNETPDTSILTGESTRKSNRRPIPRRCFEIKGEAFMIASHDGDEPNTYNEALTSSAKDLWMKAIDEEMKSMKVNQV